MKPKRTELLAPAGGAGSLHAAVSAGADAVYLGVEAFNARRGADNFTMEALGQACDYAHLRGVRVYLALNTVVLPSEIPEALETARQAYRKGVDAFIVQDIGLAAEIKRSMPEARLHISTQMNIHSIAGLEAVAELGAIRATLARELSLDEIERLSARAHSLGIELEVFAHGALCICYSGQCFLSSMIGGRSANRGLCAQACRLPYTLHNKALRKTLPATGDHLLSPKDLCAIDVIPGLFERGILSYKIEGRMKSPDYVYAVTSIYRRMLDRVEAGRYEPMADDEKRVLAEVFSRGFTTAYLENRRGNEIMSYGRPNNRGVFVGRVVSCREGKAAVAFEEDIAVGDLLEFWTNKGHFTHEVEALDSDPRGNHVFRLAQAVGKGDRVFKVRSAKAAFTDDPYAPKITICGRIEIRLGYPLKIEFSGPALPDAPAGSALPVAPAGSALPVAQTDSFPTDAPAGPTLPESEYRTGHRSASISIEGAIVETARTKAVTREEVLDHVGRFGNTPFQLKSLEIVLDEGVGIGFSQLHRIRAEALERLAEALLEPYRQRRLAKAVDGEVLPAIKKTGCPVGAWATNPACARAAKRAGADIIYVPTLHYKRGQALIAGQISETAESAGYPKQSIIALPVIDRCLCAPSCRTGDALASGIEGEDVHERGRTFDLWKHAKPGKPVFVENLGQLIQAREACALPEVGPHIPILNRSAVQVVAGWGASRVWLSPELSLAQIGELAADAPIPLGLTIMGRQELMTTEHCLLMSQGPCNEACADCQRRKSPHFLKDRKGYEFPVVTDCCGRSHLYNAVEFDIAHAAPDLIRAGVTAFMVDTTMMNVAETTKAVERAVRARDIALRSGDKVSKKEGATTGHLFRGIA